MNQMNNFPMQGIKNYIGNDESSYINSALQSLACLDCIKEWFNQLNGNNIMNNIQCFITKEFYQILKSLFSGQQVDSSNFIFNYENKYKQSKNKEPKRDVYHFIYNLLDFIHLENNMPINPNFDKKQVDSPGLQNMRNNDYMYNIFGSYFQQSLNSIISQCFFNIEKSTFNCQNCPPIYSYSLRKIFIFNVNEYKQYRDQCMSNKIGMPLNIEECLKCYSGGYPGPCQACKNNGTAYRNIFSTTRVLIIYFKRNNHNFQCDIDFQTKFTLLNKNYILKACISYCNLSKYFSDVCINNIWYRYMEDQIKTINESEIHQYEPQILIYELENCKNYRINANNNSMTNNNNNIFVNPFNYNINQMMMNNHYNNIVFTPAFQYQQMLIQQQQQRQQQQMIETMKYYQMIQNMKAMQQQMNMNNFIPNNNNPPQQKEDVIIPNNDNNGISLNFLIIPKNWDKSEEKSSKIMAQVTLDDTIEKAINNFFVKLQKKKEAITEFKFNDNTIDCTSKEKLKDIGIKPDSKIIAIKSDDYDKLNLIGNN
jgi:hypothetical protein